MDTILGACYFMTVAGMGWNMVKIKLQGDLEEDMKQYREYDLSTEKIKVGTDKIDPNGKYIVLANHKAATDKTKAEPLFAYTMPHLAPYDPTRYSEVSAKLSINN